MQNRKGEKLGGLFFLQMDIIDKLIRPSLFPAKKANNGNKYYSANYRNNNIPQDMKGKTPDKA